MPRRWVHHHTCLRAPIPSSEGGKDHQHTPATAAVSIPPQILIGRGKWDAGGSGRMVPCAMASAWRRGHAPSVGASPHLPTRSHPKI